MACGFGCAIQAAPRRSNNAPSTTRWAPPPLLLERATPLVPPHEAHAYQLHRGRFEAALAAMLERDGATLIGETEVTGVSMSDDGCDVELRRGPELSVLRCQWKHPPR